MHGVSPTENPTRQSNIQYFAYFYISSMFISLNISLTAAMGGDGPVVRVFAFRTGTPSSIHSWVAPSHTPLKPPVHMNILD